MSEENTVRERPLSPHLQVYRLPYNAIMSISGRIVGVGLCVSLLVMLWWFIAVVWHPEFYDASIAFLKQPFIKYALMLWAFAVFFYIGNGVRHVLWNMGIGLNEKAGIRSGNIVLVLSALLTFLLWQFSCGCWSNNYEAAPQKINMTQEIQVQQVAPDQSALDSAGAQVFDTDEIEIIEVIE